MTLVCGICTEKYWNWELAKFYYINQRLLHLPQCLYLHLRPPLEHTQRISAFQCSCWIRDCLTTIPSHSYDLFQWLFDKDLHRFLVSWQKMEISRNLSKKYDFSIVSFHTLAIASHSISFARRKVLFWRNAIEFLPFLDTWWTLIASIRRQLEYIYSFLVVPVHTFCGILVLHHLLFSFVLSIFRPVN